MLLVKEDWDRS